MGQSLDQPQGAREVHGMNDDPMFLGKPCDVHEHD